MNADFLWLHQNASLVHRYITTKYSVADYQYAMSRSLAEPKLMRQVLEDFQRSLVHKSQEFFSFFQQESYLVIVLGGKGSGKSFLAFSLANFLLSKGITPYWYMVPQSRLPKGHKSVFRIRDIPQGVFLIADESAIFSNPRKSMDQDFSLVDILPILRHGNNKVLAISQLSSLMDLNFFRTADARIYGKMSDSVLQFDRQNFLSPLDKELLPKNRGEYYFTSDSKLITFSLAYDANYDPYSKMFRPMGKEDVRDVIQYVKALHFDIGLLAPQIFKFLSAFRFPCTQAWVQEQIENDN